MLFINRLEQAVAYLKQGYLLAKCTHGYPGLSAEQLVAGTLMGLTQHDWWYILLGKDLHTVDGLITKALFDELYRNYYLQSVSTSELPCYAINYACEIQEAPRYQHQINSWQEMISRPEQVTGFNQ